VVAAITCKISVLPLSLVYLFFLKMLEVPTKDISGYDTVFSPLSKNWVPIM
jgi:hypothetical protein